MGARWGVSFIERRWPGTYIPPEDMTGHRNTMSDQSTPPVSPYPGPYPAPQSRPPGPDPRILLAAFVAILAIITVVALLLANGGFGGSGGNTPKGTLEDYASGLNDGDARAMFDQTTLSLKPDYESQLVWLQQTVFIGDPHIELRNVTVTDREDFTIWQQLEANSAIEDAQDELNMTVDDYCFVSATVTLSYGSFDESSTFDTEMLCVQIDGVWYLAIWGFD